LHRSFHYSGSDGRIDFTPGAVRPGEDDLGH
jgi:hypothetical protein